MHRHLITLAVLMAAAPAAAQSLDTALGHYKSKDYEDAGLAFYDVLANDANPDHRDQAQIYLAETLKKMGFLLPAFYYYQDILSEGSKNRYFLNAIEGLLAVQEELHDPVFVPIVIDAHFDKDAQSFAQLDPAKIAQVNYIIGELSFRRGKNEDAKLFLEYVPPESKLHGKARYLLGIVAVRKGNAEEALSHFKAIVDMIDEDESEAELADLRNLALVAAGRAAYGLGRYAEAQELYAKVPRYTEQWFNALYEAAWAYFRTDNYGRALGELQSVTSPYFSKHHVPEAYVIQGTAYFVNCQWDRVRKAVDRFKLNYEPMAVALKSYLDQNREPVEYYRDVVGGGNGRFSIELAREVRRSKRFKDYHFMLTHMAWELEQLDAVTEWKGSSLHGALKDVLNEQREQLEPAVGAWVKRRLTFLVGQLQNFQNQINILDFEVTDAERQWLEQGKEILKGRRARLPRPEIPNDQWQHWSFDKEFWKDEVGYFQHTLRSECF